MDIIYRPLGIAAGIGNALSRSRLNGLSGTLQVLFLLACVVIAGWRTTTDDAARNRRIDEEARAAAARASSTSSKLGDGSSVFATGSYLPLPKSAPKDGALAPELGILCDDGGQWGLAVQGHVELPKGKALQDAMSDPTKLRRTVTGTLTKLDSATQEKLKSVPKTISALYSRLEPQFMLVIAPAVGGVRQWSPELTEAPDPAASAAAAEDPVPASRFAIWYSAMAGAAVLFALLLTVFCLRYVVFRPAGAAPPRAAGTRRTQRSNSLPDARLTGVLYFEGAKAQRFLDLPVAVERGDDGGWTLSANVDASRYFMGLLSEARRGRWSATFRPGGIADAEPGWCYVGLAKRPAIRMRAEPEGSGGRAVCFLAFATTEERDTALRQLTA